MDPIIKKISKGRNIRIKANGTIMMELGESQTGIAATMVSKCKMIPSNVFRVLL